MEEETRLLEVSPHWFGCGAEWGGGAGFGLEASCVVDADEFGVEGFG